ncbi:hypothetical protein RhiJN_14830 [Ceratobasidium sp. AG-Ba]|nr:hypothetical protein RhiJN_14830 [Ceratobasidium sp. AG-Ba]
MAVDKSTTLGPLSPVGEAFALDVGEAGDARSLQQSTKTGAVRLAHHLDLSSPPPVALPPSFLCDDMRWQPLRQPTLSWPMTTSSKDAVLLAVNSCVSTLLGHGKLVHIRRVHTRAPLLGLLEIGWDGRHNGATDNGTTECSDGIRASGARQRDIDSHPWFAHRRCDAAKHRRRFGPCLDGEGTRCTWAASG